MYLQSTACNRRVLQQKNPLSLFTLSGYSASADYCTMASVRSWILNIYLCACVPVYTMLWLSTYYVYMCCIYSRIDIVDMLNICAQLCIHIELCVLSFMPRDSSHGATSTPSINRCKQIVVMLWMHNCTQLLYRMDGPCFECKHACMLYAYTNTPLEMIYFLMHEYRDWNLMCHQ